MLCSQKSWCGGHQNWLIAALGFRDPFSVINNFLQKGKESLEVRILHLILETLGDPQQCEKLLSDVIFIYWGPWLRSDLHYLFKILEDIDHDLEVCDILLELWLRVADAALLQSERKVEMQGWNYAVTRLVSVDMAFNTFCHRAELNELLGNLGVVRIYKLLLSQLLLSWGF